MRSPAKSEAAKFISAYQLGIGETCKLRVKSLKDSLRFHSAGSWGGEDGNVSKLLHGNLVKLTRFLF